METQHFDIVISGGGLSGALTALSLQNLTNQSGEKLSIAIIEANPILKDASLSFDDRVLALSHGSADYLAKVGAWQTLKADATPIETIHISDRNHIGKSRIHAKEHQVNALGYVVEMSLIGKSLLTALANKSNITWFTPARIENIHWQQSQVDIELSTKQTLTAKLLLGCDGQGSICRELANIELSSSSYEQSALIANVSTSKAHENIAFERFTETGPIAMLPLTKSSDGKSRCSLVWTLTPEQAVEIAELNDKDFARALERAFGTWLGNITFVGKRDIYPLNLVRAKAQTFHRMALVGNASHTIHPIAGQGFNLGLRDVETLAKLIETALNAGDDFGDYALLNAYEVARKQDHDQVISLTDSLVTLFSNQHFPLVVGRNISLKAFDHFGFIKKRLVNKTMGYSANI